MRYRASQRLRPLALQDLLVANQHMAMASCCFSGLTRTCRSCTHRRSLSPQLAHRMKTLVVSSGRPSVLVLLFLFLRAGSPETPIPAEEEWSQLGRRGKRWSQQACSATSDHARQVAKHTPPSPLFIAPGQWPGKPGEGLFGSGVLVSRERDLSETDSFEAASITKP